MSTVRDLLSDALLLLGVQDPSEAMSADVAAVCLRRLNAMLNTWSAQSLMVYTSNRVVLPLTIGQAAYTLGTGGDLNTPRPVWFTLASVIPTASAPTLEIPVDILDDAQWQDVSIKTISSNFPLQIHPRGDYPMNTIDVWPVPTAACSLVLYPPQQLGSFTSLDTVVSLPAAYEEAITYNFAPRIASIFGAATPPDVARIAMISLDAVRAQNLQTPLLRVDSSMCGNGSGPSDQAVRSKGYVVD